MPPRSLPTEIAPETLEAVLRNPETLARIEQFERALARRGVNRYDNVIPDSIRRQVSQEQGVDSPGAFDWLRRMGRRLHEHRSQQAASASVPAPTPPAPTPAPAPKPTMPTPTPAPRTPDLRRASNTCRRLYECYQRRDWCPWMMLSPAERSELQEELGIGANTLKTYQANLRTHLRDQGFKPRPVPRLGPLEPTPAAPPALPAPVVVEPVVTWRTEPTPEPVSEPECAADGEPEGPAPGLPVQLFGEARTAALAITDPEARFSALLRLLEFSRAHPAALTA